MPQQTNKDPVAIAVQVVDPLLRAYFPPGQVAAARCVLAQELLFASDRCGDGWPFRCVVDYRSGVRGYGLWQLRDSDWDPEQVGPYDPAQGPDGTPFTHDEWAHVLDPEWNTYMAAVVWHLRGWRYWSSCDPCKACSVKGTSIPYPRHPINVTAQVAGSLARGDVSTGSSILPALAVAGAFGLVAVAYLKSEGRL